MSFNCAPIGQFGPWGSIEVGELCPRWLLEGFKIPVYGLVKEVVEKRPPDELEVSGYPAHRYRTKGCRAESCSLPTIPLPVQSLSC